MACPEELTEQKLKTQYMFFAKESNVNGLPRSGSVLLRLNRATKRSANATIFRNCFSKTACSVVAKYPSKKILCICDNTHNYQSFSQLDPTGRMTQISNGQKLLTAKYKICMIATVEYRKNMPIDQSKLKLPVNDDIADARALMYRADVIIHVYNDLNDRGDSAEFFWIDPLDPSDPRPRLNLIFGKNKISSFKKSLALDLNPVNVTLRQVSTERKKEEYENYVNNEGLKIINGKLILEVPEWNTDQANA
ncbi:MAG: hypothetical protein HYS80_01480 [Candidatus Aenigmarchaeota archaeon]|nr:hypothetical protein [Candidatus Aenigmarchaeota archaeon]